MKYRVNAYLQSKFLAGFFFHIMSEIRKHLKDTLAFSSFLVLEPNSLVLPNTSLVVGQSSVKMSLALPARDISIHN